MNSCSKPCYTSALNSCLTLFYYFTDYNECEEDEEACDKNAYCYEFLDRLSFGCQCKDGFQGSGFQCKKGIFFIQRRLHLIYYTCVLPTYTFSPVMLAILVMFVGEHDIKEIDNTILS